MANILKRQFQYQRASRIFSNVIGPNFKSFWPNRYRDIISLNSSLFSTEIPLNHDNLGSKYSKIFRQLPMPTLEIYRENMIEWRRRRGGNKK